MHFKEYNMITVEYYWNFPDYRGPLLATYRMRGDGTPGTRSLAPLSPIDPADPPLYDRVSVEACYEELKQKPDLLMRPECNPDSSQLPWTRELVKVQTSRGKYALLAAVVVDSSARPGANFPHRKKTLRLAA